MPTLLLADDSVTIQRVIELTFAEEDITVLAVSDGDSAIAALEKTPPPDIVLADIGMPGPSGYDVAIHVRDTPRIAHIPVLLLTGAFDPIDRDRIASVGARGVLAKPFEPQFVIAQVKALLDTPDWAPAFSIPLASRTQIAASETAAESATAPVAASNPSATAEYFDRLNEALSSLETGSPTATWAIGSVEPAPERMQPVVPTTEPQSVQPTRAQDSPDTPTLADAFAALLAAEETMPSAAAIRAWQGRVQPPPTITDDMIDEITRRVLEKLSDRVVREAVGETIVAVAERLVSAEIERIKSSIS